MTEPLPHPVDAAIAVLTSREPAAKVAAARAALTALEMRGPNQAPTDAAPPMRPARPARPVLTAPGNVPKRRLGSPEGRIALLHAVAHIEFNAIDLAFDMAARFYPVVSDAGLDGDTFFADWIRIGEEEARHFSLIAARLGDYGAVYGDVPAHDGLWEAADATAHDVLARLAIAPMVLEARGLDVTPGMIDRLTGAGDKKSAAVLQIIYNDEIGHVACGKRWFHEFCMAQGKEPKATFRTLCSQHYAGELKPPFNHAARAAAGMDRTYYEEVDGDGSD